MVMWLVPIAVGLVCACDEWLHWRRVRRAGRLVFGRHAQPRRWTIAAPILRILCAGALAWSFLVLVRFEPMAMEIDPEDEPSRHLLLCLDVSPSMYLEDAGPDRTQRRMFRARDLLEAVFARLDMTRTRVSIIAFYTSARPVVLEAFDLNVVRNVLDGLPLEHAFDVGETKMQEGVVEAMEFARAWPEGSAALIVVSDGDTVAGEKLPQLPRSIADVMVVGVGNPHRGTPIAGRTSRQDEASLRRLAVRLGGLYHNGNEKHISSAALESFSMTAPRMTDPSTLRDLALAIAAIAASVLALIGPALAMFGAPHAPAAVGGAVGIGPVGQPGRQHGGGGPRAWESQPNAG